MDNKMTLPLCRDCNAKSADCAYGDLRLTQSCDDAVARSRKRFQYRQNRGGFIDSLQTSIQVDSLSDIVVHEQANGVRVKDTSELTCELYATDTRIPEWSDTYSITLKGTGILGFTNGPVEGYIA